MSFGPNPYDPPQSLPPGQPGYPQDGPNQTALVLAIASLTMALFSFTSHCCCFFAVFLGLSPIAILVGIVALTQKPDQTAKGLAIAGIACGALSLVLWFVLFILQIAGFAVQQQFRPQ